MSYSELNHHNATFSQLKSVTGNDFFSSNIGNQHNLPHITQPILAKYRIPRNPNDLII